MKQYEFIKSLRTTIRILNENGINQHDEKYISLMDDYIRLKKEGHKYTFIMYYLSETYGVSESSVVRIVNRLNQDVSIV